MSAAEGNWTNLPLHQVLFEWLIKNASFPTDMSIIVAYFALFLIVWFTMVWATRFIISIIWPLILIASGIALFHIVKFYEPEDIANMVTNVLTKVLDTIGLILGTFFESIGKFLE